MQSALRSAYGSTEVAAVPRPWTHGGAVRPPFLRRCPGPAAPPPAPGLPPSSPRSFPRGGPAAGTDTSCRCRACAAPRPGERQTAWSRESPAPRCRRRRHLDPGGGGPWRSPSARGVRGAGCGGSLPPQRAAPAEEGAREPGPGRRLRGAHAPGNPDFPPSAPRSGRPPRGTRI